MLPWRDLKIADETERAYRILVSEVMLQQTQVTRVKIVFKNFMKLFPQIQDLARASNRDVLIAWRGMGYNSRALRLRDAAREIVARYIGSLVARKTSYQATKLPVTSCLSCTGHFPRCMDCLMSIPGIGPYTAAAIRNFAFGIPTACLDTNIRRALHMTFVGPPNADGTWKRDDRYLLKLAGEVLEAALREAPANCLPLEARRAKWGQLSTVNSSATAEWHAALMDYGSMALPKVRPVRKVQRKEPGRTVGTRFTPNRIFRGRIVETLRDAKRGLKLAEIGKRVCPDWKPSGQRKWLRGILEKLELDALIKRRGSSYTLMQ